MVGIEKNSKNLFLPLNKAQA